MAAKDGESLVVGEWESLAISPRSFGSRIPVQVRPKSSRSAILGVRDGALVVALTSPPADGAANGELLGLLAKALGVRKTDLSIEVGLSSRKKLIDVNGVAPTDARALLKRARK